MHDLRKQALLESGKTVSRKARSRQSTPGGSRLVTPAASRAPSRNRAGSSRGDSDDEGDGDLSDGTSFSVGSIDEMLHGDVKETAAGAWQAELADRIEEIFARKGSTVLGREKCYKTYIYLLTTQYAEEDIRGKEEELATAFLKSIKEERSEKEAVLAAKALAITLITLPSDLIFEAASVALRRAITHSESVASKTAAIHALSICTFYGGASDEGIQDSMDFLFEIITSDGHLIFAPDELEPVLAAIEEWGFLCTLVDDISVRSEDAIEALAEQLSSSYAAIQIVAGENIALLYEKSFRSLDEDNGQDSPGDYSEADILSDPDEIPGVSKLIRLYPAYRRTDQLLHKLESLSRSNDISVHRVSKADRKALKTNLSDIANSISFPHRGPRYSNAIDEESGKRYGSRLTMRINSDGIMRIDRWWKLLRLQALKRVLQSGFLRHYERNEVVFETLPIMITNDRKR